MPSSTILRVRIPKILRAQKFSPLAAQLEPWVYNLRSLHPSAAHLTRSSPRRRTSAARQPRAPTCTPQSGAQGDAQARRHPRRRTLAPTHQTGDAATAAPALRARGSSGSRPPHSSLASKRRRLMPSLSVPHGARPSAAGGLLGLTPRVHTCAPPAHAACTAAHPADTAAHPFRPSLDLELLLHLSPYVFALLHLSGSEQCRLPVLQVDLKLLLAYPVICTWLLASCYLHVLYRLS